MAESEALEAQMTTATTQVPIESHAEEASHQGYVLGFDGQMVLLTWIAFIISALLLGKLLWKPILKAIEAREAEIKSSLDDAATARKAAQEADVLAKQTLETAEADARERANAVITAAQSRADALQAEAREVIAQKRKSAEERLEVERENTLKRLREQAGDEIAAALEQILPGLLTDDQRKAYQEKIAAEVRF